ncbi:MAG: RcpC/CpaB family pilus assembly protein [Acidimicrobiales bacterium]
MVDLGTQPAVEGMPASGAGHERGRRQVGRRRGLPGGRAVVGGFLVTASVVGVFAAYVTAGSGPATSYAVVRADVAAGERLGTDNLALVPLELPAEQEAVAFAETEGLVGATALGPLSAGQLVQTSDVANPLGSPERAQISLPVEPGRALGGELRAGEQVDVIATYTTGGEPVTTTVSTGAIVVRTVGADQAVGSSGALTVVLAVPPAELEPIAQAASVGEVAIARTTGLERR